jgi:beta-aspartyl-dipeptidase (metallo-type)
MARGPEKSETMILIRGGHVFSPHDLGVQDILLAAGSIAAVAEPSSLTLTGLEIEIIDASARTVIPGFVDSHVHILGGGGEGGPTSRAPEISLETVVSSGVSTLIGLLGTDCTTRHLESLLAKANGLEEEGVDTYVMTGGWGVPTLSLTGSVQSDLVLIEKVVGVGELAIADPLSTQPNLDDLAKVAAECRLGGLIGKKAGILHIHAGTDGSNLEMLYGLVETKGIPPTQIIPTHINYSIGLLEDSVAFIEGGGRVDLNAFGDPTSEKNAHSIASAVQFYREKNISLDNISISSDANGSLAQFDDSGRMTGLTVAEQGSLLANFRFLQENKVVDLESAIKLFSTNPARFYQLEKKGQILAGKDADFLMLDSNTNLTDVIFKGRRMMIDGEVVARGAFESQ